MRKLKKQKLHAIYITIITAMICAILWTNLEFRQIFAFGMIPTLITFGFLDSRFQRLFE